MDAGVIVPWTVWQAYGDSEVIRRHWPAMTRFLEFCRKQSPDLRGSNKFNPWMGGGEIARVIRFIIAYATTRCVMNVMFAVNQTWAPVARGPEELLNVVFPWIFLMGVTLRARVAVRAEQELARVAATEAAAS